MKYLLVLMISTLVLSVSAQEAIRTSPADFNTVYRQAKTAYQAGATYETAWQFAKAAYEYGSHGLTANQNEQKKAIFEEGKNAAQKARDLNRRGVEGHYWFGTNLGSWAETNGVMASLFAAGDLLAAADEAVRINAGYMNGGPLVLRGRVFHKAPGWPISVGDKAKSEADFQRAMTMNPSTNRTLRRFYGELLADLGKKDEARRIFQQGINLAPDASNPFVDTKELNLIRESLAKL